MHRTTYNAKAYSAASETSPLASTKIKRRDPTDRDVQIEILFCGICHSDLHSVRNEWSEFLATNYPIVPGHEIVGRVTKVGSAVTKYKAGDLAAVGCMVDSDGTCPQCKAGLEQSASRVEERVGAARLQDDRGKLQVQVSRAGVDGQLRRRTGQLIDCANEAGKPHHRSNLV